MIQGAHVCSSEGHCKKRSNVLALWEMNIWIDPSNIQDTIFELLWFICIDYIIIGTVNETINKRIKDWRKRMQSWGQWWILEWGLSLNLNLCRMWGKGNPLGLLVGMQTSIATLENSMETPQKVKNRTEL